MLPRLAIYGALSTALFGAVVSSAIKTRPNFYAAAVALGRSSGALMVLANFALFNAIWVGVILKTIFFGRLRAIEYEHLFERLWIFLTESLLALTIFRDDFSMPFAFMYGVLLFLKCFHWITADRVDYMDQIPPPGPPALFHVRTSVIICLLTLADLVLVTYSLESILLDGVSAMVLFGSEFMILLASISGTTARYVIGLMDLRRARGRVDAPSWEAKSMYLFYVDLATDFAKLLTYLTFFAVILLHYGLPLHILRDVYMTLRSFLGRVGDLIRYRRATRDMDTLYPDASPEEVERTGDRTCIICREEMVSRAAAQATGREAGEGGPNETPKRLACGHVFHFHCLRSWLERQQSCPTCRRDVLRTPAPTGRPRNPIPNPPPAAPGAVPQANGDAQAPPLMPMQVIYEQFFQPRAPPQAPPPALNGVGQAGPTALPQPNGNNQRDDTAGQGNGDDQRIQSGIWGGPVTPGRFFARPLGAAPTWPPPPSATGLGAGLSRIGGTSSLQLSAPHTNGNTSPRPERLEPLDISAASGTRPSAAGEGQISTGSVTIPQPSPQVASGSTTPFSSNPPEIFSSPGSSREGEIEARRAAAEAALRRLGLGVSPIIQPGAAQLSVPQVALPEAAQNGVVDEDHRTEKGKGKERDISPLDEEAKYIPYLAASAPLRAGLGDRPGSWTSTPSDADGTRTALVERIRLLRDVDESVWRLVGELSRVKSAWEVEDGITRSGGEGEGDEVTAGAVG